VYDKLVRMLLCLLEVVNKQSLIYCASSISYIECDARIDNRLSQVHVFIADRRLLRLCNWSLLLCTVLHCYRVT